MSVMDNTVKYGKLYKINDLFDMRCLVKLFSRTKKKLIIRKKKHDETAAIHCDWAALTQIDIFIQTT